MDTVTFFLFAILIFFLVYKNGTKNFNFWVDKGIRQGRPVPFLGDHWPAVFRMGDGIKLVLNYYKPFAKDGLGGIYLFRTPFLIVTDPHLLKQILVKDAEHFMNRYDWVMNVDPIMKKNLLILKDEKWREMRAVMTTVFTSAKMKDMFNFMNTCGEQSAKYIQQKIEKQLEDNHPGGDIFELEIKDFYSRYSTDVIATTAFGLEVDSMKNPNNEFYEAGVSIRNAFQGFAIVRVFFIMIFPEIAKKLNITFLEPKCNRFFISIVSEAIREREAKNIRRADVIQILMDARKGKGVGENGEQLPGKLPDLTDTDIAGQAMLFFFAGFETISTLLSFISYELAVNPDIQKTVQEEIDNVIEEENGVTYYGIMQKMQYLNMVVYETLRKWPPAVFSDRQVSKPYIIPKTANNPSIALNRGDKVFIPIAGLHYDPEHFPNPEKFDPERFRDEKNTIKPFTFLAFGEGLRHCIGMRFALMEAKTIIVHVLKKFTIVPTKKTPIPLKLTKKKPFILDVDEGFCLGLQLRK